MNYKSVCSVFLYYIYRSVCLPLRRKRWSPKPPVSEWERDLTQPWSERWHHHHSILTERNDWNPEPRQTQTQRETQWHHHCTQTSWWNTTDVLLFWRHVEISTAFNTNVIETFECFHSAPYLVTHDVCWDALNVNTHSRYWKSFKLSYLH